MSSSIFGLANSIIWMAITTEIWIKKNGDIQLKRPRSLVDLLGEDLFVFWVGFVALGSVGRRAKRSKTACRILSRGHSPSEECGY
jgi:hypothetical protein